MTPSQVQPLHGMSLNEPIHNGDHMGNTIARVKNETFVPALRHQGKECLSLEVAAAKTELLKDNLRHFFAVLSTVERRLSHQNFLIGHGLGCVLA